MTSQCVGVRTLVRASRTRLPSRPPLMFRIKAGAGGVCGNQRGGMSRRLYAHRAEGLGGFIAGGVIVVSRSACPHAPPRASVPRAPNLLPALSVPPSVGGADLGALLCDGLFAGGTRHCVLGRRGIYLYTNMHAVHLWVFQFPISRSGRRIMRRTSNGIRPNSPMESYHWPKRIYTLWHRYSYYV